MIMHEPHDVTKCYNVVLINYYAKRTFKVHSMCKSILISDHITDFYVSLNAYIADDLYGVYSN